MLMETHWYHQLIEMVGNLYIATDELQGSPGNRNRAATRRQKFVSGFGKMQEAWRQRSWHHFKGAKVNAGLSLVMEKLQQTTGEKLRWEQAKGGSAGG